MKTLLVYYSRTQITEKIAKPFKKTWIVILKKLQLETNMTEL